MWRLRRPSFTLPLYLLPIMIGLCGILFSQQFATTWVRTIVILVSVAAPLFAAGTAMARLPAAKAQRVVILAGVFMLTLGAGVTLWDISNDFDLTGVLVPWSEVPQGIWDASRWIGMLGLLLGLVVTLYTVVRREEEVGQLAGRFSSLTELMGEGFVLTSADGHISGVNKQFLSMTGLSEHEVVGKDARQFAERLNLQPVLRELDKREKGIASEYRLAWELGGGRKRHLWVSGAPIFDRSGRFAGTLATFRDVSELHELNERLEEYTKGLQQLVEERTQELRLSQERLRGLLLHMSEGFTTVDTSFRIRFANERMRTLVRIDPSALVGRSLFDFLDTAARGHLLDLFRLAGQERGEPLQQEVTLIRGDGARVPIVVAIAPITAEKEDGARYSVVMTDVSDLKRMQRQLEERANELESVNDELRTLGRARDSFLSNVTHELRTPLSTVRGYIEMFESGSFGDLDQPRKHAFDVMARNVERLGLLIEEMIDFSRMQIRGIELAVNLFPVGPLVAEIAQSAEPQARAKRLHVEVEVDQELPLAWGDRTRISQVLTIFVSNAIKFSHEEGTIIVRARQEPDRTLAIDVVDQGIGIDPSNHARVFEKFFQVDNSLSRKYEGTGIGLSIAKSIADAHGGRIALASAVGKGSTFSLVLPGALFNPDVTDTTRGRLGQLHVVLANASAEARQALRASLEQAGVSVEPVESAYGCLRVAIESNPDVVLLADALPDLTCEETLRRLRDEFTTANTPVIVFASQNKPQLYLEYSCHGLKPPFCAEALARMIIRVCHGLAEAVISPTPSEERRNQLPGVLLLDPDGDFLEWLETALRGHKIVCHRAGDLERARELAAAGLVEAAVLEVGGAAEAAQEVVDLLREASENSTLPVYGTTSVAQGLTAAADKLNGILRKPFKIQELLEMMGRGERVTSVS